jgi:hypothetical protein
MLTLSLFYILKDRHFDGSALHNIDIVTVRHCDVLSEFGTVTFGTLSFGMFVFVSAM